MRAKAARRPVGKSSAARKFVRKPGTAPSGTALSPEGQRRLLAKFLKLHAERLGFAAVDGAVATAAGRAETSHKNDPKISPRMRETLDRLLVGDSEKQVALRLSLSKNTVHVYVKALYRVYGVNSRGELLARFVARPHYREVAPGTDPE